MAKVSEFSSSSTASDVCERYGNRAKGKIVAITGCTGGIGENMAVALAVTGSTVVMLRRDEAKMAAISQRVEAAKKGAVMMGIKCDTSSFTSVRNAAATVLSKFPGGIDCLVNNAGTCAPPPGVTADGLEIQFATNVAGHYLLTELLMPALVLRGTSNEPSRVINVASDAYKMTKGVGMNPEAYEKPDVYSGIRQYAHTKLANVLHARELNRRLKEAGKPVVAFSLHPGAITSTDIARNYGLILGSLFRLFSAPFSKTIPQGASTQTFLVLAPIEMLEPGKIYQDCKVSPAVIPEAENDTMAKDFWEYLAKKSSMGS